nr:hypothetical protein Iba_chr12cCG20740 [Ipomoea batatas]
MPMNSLVMALKLVLPITLQPTALDFSWLADCSKSLKWIKTMKEMLRLPGRTTLLNLVKAGCLSVLFWMLVLSEQPPGIVSLVP